VAAAQGYGRRLPALCRREWPVTLLGDCACAVHFHTTVMDTAAAQDCHKQSFRTLRKTLRPDHFCPLVGRAGLHGRSRRERSAVCGHGHRRDSW
jgi:hypothetical protein